MAICTSRKSTLDVYRNSRRDQEPTPRFYSPSRSIPPGSRKATIDCGRKIKQGWAGRDLSRPAWPFSFFYFGTWKIENDSAFCFGERPDRQASISSVESVVSN